MVHAMVLVMRSVDQDLIKNNPYVSMVAIYMLACINYAWMQLSVPHLSNSLIRRLNPIARKTERSR